LRDRPRERPSAVIRFPFSRKHLEIVSLFGGNHTTPGSTKDERTGHRGNRQNERDRPCLASNTLMLIYRRL
jgi:hypothetical protein